MAKQIKIALLLLGLSLVSFFLHNAIYGVFKIEEPVFFLLTFIFALAFVISLISGIIALLK